jgi:DNA-binding MarR family transcriptional regulator
MKYWTTAGQGCALKSECSTGKERGTSRLDESANASFASHISGLLAGTRGLSPAEHSSLITIRDNPSVTQSEVASALRIQLPHLVKILLKLEANGLIKRKRSNRDKRAI